MKKITSLLALLTVVASLSLTACSSPSGTPDANTDAPDPTTTEETPTAPTDNQ